MHVVDTALVKAVFMAGWCRLGQRCSFVLIAGNCKTGYRRLPEFSGRAKIITSCLLDGTSKCSTLLLNNAVSF